MSDHYLQAPPGFKPLCLDCAYDLAGLEDGRCPECGHLFSRDRLIAAFNFRMDKRRRRLASVRNVPVILAFVPMWSGLWPVTYVSFAINAAMVVSGGVGWYLLCREKFIEGAHWLLCLPLPLLIMFLNMATHEHGMVGMLVTLAITAIVAFVALRGSPLISSVVLALAVLVPTASFSALLIIDGVTERAAGHHWSNFDYPAFPRWRAFTSQQAVDAGLLLMGLFAVLIVGIVLVAKRARIRLRRPKALVPAESSPRRFARDR